jgi:hypothetical protein
MFEFFASALDHVVQIKIWPGAEDRASFQIPEGEA